MKRLRNPKIGSWHGVISTRIVHYHRHDAYVVPSPFHHSGSAWRLSGIGYREHIRGPITIEWDTNAQMTPLRQLPFFVDFLKVFGLFDAFVADYPLRYTSPNAPKKREVLGTAMLSVLSGHKRYAHIAALR